MVVLITSYQRLDYLKQTVASLRQDEIELCIIDGGSDEKTCRWISQNADTSIFASGNPGADALKNLGMRHYPNEKVCMLSSDDLVYPIGYAKKLLDQYEQINFGVGRYPIWTFMAGAIHNPGHPYLHETHGAQFTSVNGIPVLPVSHGQVAGAILDVSVWKALGGFPELGISGQGDHAFSNMLWRAGYMVGYFAEPVVEHIGIHRRQDYPDYSRRFEEDQAYWNPIALKYGL